jgi:hypothetical protein
VFLGRFLRQRGVQCGQSAEAKLIAELKYALMLDIHHLASAAISSSYTRSEC